MNIGLNIIGFFILSVTLILSLVLLIKLIIFFIKRKDFPRKILTATIMGVVLFLGLFIYLQYFFTFNDINREHMQAGPGQVLSPTGIYAANAYYEPYGGASSSSGVNVWVEIKNAEDKTTKTIYYADAKSEISMIWIDEETLSIYNKAENSKHENGIELNVVEEIYHENGLACKSLLMKKEYETCYQN